MSAPLRSSTTPVVPSAPVNTRAGGALGVSAPPRNRDRDAGVLIGRGRERDARRDRRGLVSARLCVRGRCGYVEGKEEEGARTVATYIVSYVRA